jgi:hypothetical protein
MIAKRNGQPWSRRDLKVMRMLARRKMPARKAAPLLGRTVSAVKWCAMVRGIRFHHIEQKRGTQRTPEQRARLSRITAARHARNRRARR